MKYYLFLLSCFVPITSISIENCHVGSTDHISFYQCEINVFQHSNEGDIQSVKLCFPPNLNFKLVRMTLYLNEYDRHRYIADLKKAIFRDGFNEVELKIKKRDTDTSDYYISVNREPYSSGEVKNWRLKRNKILLSMLGSWKGSQEFISFNASHSTNCLLNIESTTMNPSRGQTIPSTLKPNNRLNAIKCKKPIELQFDGKSHSSTVCLFDSSYLLKLQVELNLNICYKPYDSLVYLSLSLYKVNDEIYEDIFIVEKFTRWKWNEIDMTIKPYAYNLKFETAFGGQTTSLPRADISNSKQSLALIFLGEWEGSSDFRFGNNQILNNCPDKRPQTPALTTTTISPTYSIPITTSTFGSNDVTTEEIDPTNSNSNSESQAFIFYTAGSVLLMIVIIGLVVVFLVWRKARITNKATRGSDIRHNRLPEVADPTSDVANTNINQELDDSPYYANIPDPGQNHKKENRGQLDEVAYLELDFGAVNKKQGKSNKSGNKVTKTSNLIKRGQPAETKEIAYASIEPEVFVGKDEVAYANVGEYQNRDLSNRNINEEVIYANVNK